MGVSDRAARDQWARVNRGELIGGERHSLVSRRPIDLLMICFPDRATRVRPCCRSAIDCNFCRCISKKLAKAFLCGQLKTEAEIARVQRTHNVIAKTLPMLVKQYWSQINETRKPRPAEVRRLRDLCLQIDLLCPGSRFGADETGQLRVSVDRHAGRRTGCRCAVRSLVQRVVSRIYSRDASVLLKAAEIACRDLQRTESVD